MPLAIGMMADESIESQAISGRKNRESRLVQRLVRDSCAAAAWQQHVKRKWVVKNTHVPAMGFEDPPHFSVKYLFRAEEVRSSAPAVTTIVW
jgi:hypothetical protein